MYVHKIHTFSYYRSFGHLNLRSGMAAYSGGYDCEFVENPPKVVQSECPLCLHTIREPYQADCCGSTFCRVCVERVKTDNRPCPRCKAKKFDTFEDKRLKQTLYEFKVYCTNKKQGCKWVGQLSQLDNHLNSNPTQEKQLEGCQFTLIQCLYGSGLVQRSDIKVHQSYHCTKRPYSCEHCKSYYSTFEDITTNHWLECDYYPIQCTNECGKTIKRQELYAHIANDCSMTVIDCEFSHVGCKVKVPRKRMAAHLRENVAKHISLQVANGMHMVNQLKKENEQLKKEVGRLTQDLQQICTPICPPMFTMDKFKQHKKDNDVWYSLPFYTHHKGYKMCLGVCANGYGERKGTHTSVAVQLMKGEFDDQLKWPFRGQITIRLISQVDMDYKELKYSFTESVPDYNTVSSRQLTKEIGRGLSGSISHTELQLKYLKNDSIKLSVLQYIPL